MLSIQRQITSGTLLTVSYVGNQGHRILALVSVNPGDPALCLSLSGCGPFGEDSTYTNSAGQTINGTRVGQSGAHSSGKGQTTAKTQLTNRSQLQLQCTRNHPSFPARRFAVPAQLRLCEVDRSRLKSRGTTQSHRPPAEPRHLGLGSEARLRGELYPGLADRQSLAQEQSSDRGMESLRHHPLHYRLSCDACLITRIIRCWAHWAMAPTTTCLIPRNTCLGRSRSTGTAAMAARHLTLPCSRRKLSVSSEMPSAEIFMGPGLRISI